MKLRECSTQIHLLGISANDTNSHYDKIDGLVFVTT